MVSEPALSVAEGACPEPRRVQVGEFVRGRGVLAHSEALSAGRRRGKPAAGGGDGMKSHRADEISVLALVKFRCETSGYDRKVQPTYRSVLH